MARKDFRELTVTEAAGNRKAGTPGIRIQGQWLQELGFKVEDPVLVQCENGRLVIQKDELRIRRREQEQEELKRLQERYEAERKRIKDLPLPDSYEVTMTDVEADSSGETEAGTIQRDVIRMGVVQIAVAFSVTAKWLKILTAFKQQESISVQYYDPETFNRRTAQMFIEGYQAKLRKDTSYQGLWEVSFTLREF